MRKLLFSMVALVAIALSAKAAEPTYTAVGTVSSGSAWDAAGYTNLTRAGAADSYTVTGTVSVIDSTVIIDGYDMTQDTYYSKCLDKERLNGLKVPVTVYGNDSIYLSDWFGYGKEGYNNLVYNAAFILKKGNISKVNSVTNNFYYSYGNCVYTGYYDPEKPESTDSTVIYFSSWQPYQPYYSKVDNDTETKTGRMFVGGQHAWNCNTYGYYYITWKPDENERVKEVAISIGDEGYRTYSSGESLDFSAVSDYVKAYYAPNDTNALKENRIVLKEVTGGVPAYTGLLLKSVKGGAVTVSVPVTDDVTPIETNLFVPIIQEGKMAPNIDGWWSHYLLTKRESDGKVGFYRVKGYVGWAAAKYQATGGDHIAYLKTDATIYPLGSDASGAIDTNERSTGSTDYIVDFELEDNDPSTGIKSVKAVKAVDNAYYTLSGVKVSKPTAKGVYIKNGKKIVVR